MSKYYIFMDVQVYERESYFSKDISQIPIQGQINSKEWEVVDF